MLRKNCTRSGCKDVFRAFLVENANYDGKIEIPKIAASYDVPNRMLPFSKAIRSTDYDQWVCFYEDDVKFERLWNNPKKYLPILKRFNGVISPDYSLYRDMPLVMQEWNTYRGHAIASWLQESGIRVIPNVRWGDERTYDFCCLGIEPNSTIAVGSHGCVKSISERKFFKDGLDHVIKKLSPQTIVVYGTTPENVFDEYRNNGINFIQFDSDCMINHRKAVND